MITRIGESAFSESSLTSITIPKNVVSIGHYAFDNCGELTSVVFDEDNKLLELGASAFNSCSNLSEINLPNTIVSFGNDVFAYCPKLPVTQENGVDYLAAKDNNYFICLKAHDEGLTSNVVIKNGCKFIMSNAFEASTVIDSVTIPNGVTSIGFWAFAHSTLGGSIVIPNSVIDMGANVFEECGNLTTINCEAPSKPSGWNNYWNEGCEAQVVWGYKPVTANK